MIAHCSAAERRSGFGNDANSCWMARSICSWMGAVRESVDVTRPCGWRSSVAMARSLGDEVGCGPCDVHGGGDEGHGGIWPGPLDRGRERLVEVGDDVIRVFDADAEPDHLGAHTRLALLGRRHLPMCGGGRVAGQRFGVAQIHEALDEREGVVESLAGLEDARVCACN